MKRSPRFAQKSMYRAVLDTNVIVSGTATTSTVPYQVLESWRNGDYVLVTSPQILAEVHEVLLRPQVSKFTKIPVQQASTLVSHIAQRAYVTPGNFEVDVVEDPDDNKFIACAIEGSASHIVSGDKHLLDIGEYEGVKIVKPREFLEDLQKDKNQG